MPNYCSNSVIITGTDLYKIKAIIDEHKSEEEPHFQMSWFTPRPLSFDLTHHGGRKINGVSYVSWAEIPEGRLEEAEKDLPLTADRETTSSGMLVVGIRRKPPTTGNIVEDMRIMREVEESSPPSDWYAWSIQNWGTKWDLDVSRFEIGDQEIRVWFNTAWSPPETFFKNLTERFNIKVDLCFAEQGCSFAGGQTFSGGANIREYKIDCQEGFYLPYDDEDDEEPELRPHIEAFLDEHGLHPGG